MKKKILGSFFAFSIIVSLFASSVSASPPLRIYVSPALPESTQHAYYSEYRYGLLYRGWLTKDYCADFVCKYYGYIYRSDQPVPSPYSHKVIE
ncbi:hypothetical protein BC6307_19110 [Sutcliffiella cohnii]|uniref:Uncharacterized protein n=1 Tax=Sutcliffiella cohnii TaxID=33932 RepID=A0A223KV54_9BACI|nr:hypothetical protein [Sutcliffiella cohnii]AST93218.1 hypothetical protein BC6307_19110 [Sutcliffiella cohnii]